MQDGGISGAEIAAGGVRGDANKARISDDLWKNYAESKNVDIRNMILTTHLDIVKVIAGRMYNTYKNHAEQDDIISCGVLALMDAINGFDFKRGVKFETYASLRIRGSIIDYLRKQDWVPRNTRRAAKNIEETYAAVQAEYGRPPNDGELAQRLGMGMDEYYRVLDESASFTIMSFEELIYEATAVEEPADATPEGGLQRKELRQVLADSIDDLSEKERLVVTLYYYEELKSKDIAEILGVSESRVSQIHSKALAKLKAGLKEYITT